MRTAELTGIDLCRTIGIRMRMAKVEKVENKQLGADRQIFPRVLMWTGIALLVILIAAVFLARPAAKRIQPVNPAPHSDVRLYQLQQAC